jgi:DNA-binding MarR family transcriptional regulator
MSEFFNDYLGYLLARSSFKTSNELHQRFKQEGVSVLTWRILAATQESSKTVNQLAALVLVNQSTLSKALDRLEAEDLIQRKQNQQQRRKINVSITKKGRHLISTLIPIAKEYEHQSFNQLNEEEKSTLRQILKKVLDR